MSVFVLLGGLVLLVAGAEGFVRGAARLAGLLGLSPLVIGLTVVSIGTSSPEIVLSVNGALSGHGDLAVGNAVGSNIFNVLFILGLAALIAPLGVAQRLIRREVPLMIALSLLVLGLALDGGIGRAEGLALLFGGVVYTVSLVRAARREGEAGDEFSREFAPPPTRRRRVWAIHLGLALGGLALLLVGSRLFVDGAVAIAAGLGVPPLVIGLTVVAAGTSMPEVATSVIAGLRGERDIAVGNVVGSNIFNIFLVLGSSALVADGGLPVPDTALRFDIPVMIAVAVACLPIALTGHRIDRWEGGLFLAFYLLYLGWLVAEALAHPGWLGVRAAVGVFVIPLGLLTAGVVLWRSRSRPTQPGAQ